MAVKHSSTRLQRISTANCFEIIKISQSSKKQTKKQKGRKKKETAQVLPKSFLKVLKFQH